MKINNLFMLLGIMLSFGFIKADEEPSLGYVTGNLPATGSHGSYQAPTPMERPMESTGEVPLAYAGDASDLGEQAGSVVYVGRTEDVFSREAMKSLEDNPAQELQGAVVQVGLQAIADVAKLKLTQQAAFGGINQDDPEVKTKFERLQELVEKGKGLTNQMYEELTVQNFDKALAYNNQILGYTTAMRAVIGLLPAEVQQSPKMQNFTQAVNKVIAVSGTISFLVTTVRIVKNLIPAKVGEIATALLKATPDKARAGLELLSGVGVAARARLDRLVSAAPSKEALMGWAQYLGKPVSWGLTQARGLLTKGWAGIQGLAGYIPTGKAKTAMAQLSSWAEQNPKDAKIAMILAGTAITGAAIGAGVMAYKRYTGRPSSPAVTDSGSQQPGRFARWYAGAKGGIGRGYGAVTGAASRAGGAIRSRLPSMPSLRRASTKPGAVQNEDIQIGAPVGGRSLETIAERQAFEQSLIKNQ